MATGGGGVASGGVAATRGMAAGGDATAAGGLVASGDATAAGATAAESATRRRDEVGLATGSVAWVAGASDGPLLLCVGGLHGNEPAGVLALEEVVSGLEARRDRMRGDLVAVAGNLGALAARRRFVAYDLNRAWTVDRVAELGGGERGGGGGGGSSAPDAGASSNGRGAGEDSEVRRLLAVLAEVAERRRGPVFVLDIHTTSGGGGAFTTTSDYLGNRRFAMEIPAPLVLGLDEAIEGTLIGYLDDFGYTTAVFECGQHEEEEAVRRAVSAVWLAIGAAGLLAEDDAPEARGGRKALRRAFRRLPRVLEVRYRHPAEEEDRYMSRPGFLNFQPVRAGEVLGDDRRGQVTAPESGRILMPLYQEQGEDAFFVVRAFSRFWLWLSWGLRRARLGRLAHWLPGVRRDPRRRGTVLVDRRVARWGALGAMRLLGYRPESDDGETMVATALERDPRSP